MTKEKLIDWLSSNAMRTSAVLHLEQFVIEKISGLNTNHQEHAYCTAMSEIIGKVKENLTKDQD